MKPPGWKEVLSYFQMQGAGYEVAKAFFDRYDSNGWNVIKINAETSWRPVLFPMKNWKKAATRFVDREKTRAVNRFYRNPL